MEIPRVPRPIMYQHWRRLTFLHWPYPSDVVQRLLPRGLSVETFDGTAWIGLVPFAIDPVRAPGTPAVPWLSRFPETNVRTYVRRPEGGSGIWFFSLDAARLPAVLAARAGYWLPYFWSSMGLRVEDWRYRYRSARRWPGPRGAHCNADIERGHAIEPNDLEVFLTYRFRLYSLVAGRLVEALAEHPPWPLFSGRVQALDENVVAAAGLPPPAGEPLVHTSPGVAVRIGMWHPVDLADTGSATRRPGS